MLLKRRDFLKAGAVSLSAFLLPPGAARRARASGNNNVLVVLYQRGGADGMQIVVPRGDLLYYSLRPDIQVPAGTELDLNSFFGLNPAFSPLLPLYQSGDVAFIHASGSTDPSRSHFDAQDFMERAAPGNKSITDGWLSRYLMLAGNGDPIQGITLDKTKVRSIMGPAPSIAFTSIADFDLGGKFIVEHRAALEGLYATVPGLLGGAVNDAFGAIDLVAGIDTTTSVVYPSPSDIAPALQDAAALIKADISIKIICVNIGGWDHHSNIGGRMDSRGGDLAASLAAFWEDLGACQSTTLTLCMTEFGRRPAQNGGGGTDHGHGGLMTAMGGGLAGGRVILKDDTWPGLAPDDLFNGQDLQVTTDFRDVFAEVLDRHIGLADPGRVFPSFNSVASNYPGLFT